jgi:peptidoglycan/xylan/chitin deacetylase (PgdA/CDA1 family)
MSRRQSALVVSLDFELHWGVRDKRPADGDYRQNILGVRKAIPRMLELFEEYRVAATWATVGFVFAKDRKELESSFPKLKPAYADPQLDPYREAQLGDDEQSDPLHFGASLVDEIQRYPRHEIGTHTFSHYYCLEQGQSIDTFRADLQSAIDIAAKRGVKLRSLVFPRNQRNPSYDRALRDAGIVAYRGNQLGWMHRATSGESSPVARAARLTDCYLPLSPRSTPWDAVRTSDGLCNVAANMFLRPWSARLRHLEPLRRERITRALTHAARRGEIFHLWWHPHNFGTRLEDNLAFLRAIFEAYSGLRSQYGMQSMTMGQVADAA